MKNILITPRGFANFGMAYKKILEKENYEVTINTTGKPLEKSVFEKKAQEATGLIVGVETIDSALLERCKSLKAIVKFGMGTDNIDLEACEKLGIKVGKCAGTNANAVAEFTFGLMLASARKIPLATEEVKTGNWTKYTGLELKGKKLGILGFGNIGQKVAKIATGFGMEISVYDVFSIEAKYLQAVHAKQKEFADILASSDFITLHIPLLPSTEKLISTNEFNQMKSSAILINASRGGIVDEKALLKALNDNQIYAAALDVFSNEPPEKEPWVRELLQNDRFLLTPHIASRTEEAEQQTAKVAAKTLVALLEK